MQVISGPHGEIGDIRRPSRCFRYFVQYAASQKASEFSELDAQSGMRLATIFGEIQLAARHYNILGVGL